MHQGVVFINFWVVTLCTVMLLLAVLCSIHAAGHCGWSSRLWTLAARIATQWRLSQQNCWQMVSHYASVLCYSVYWDQISVYLATVIILGKYSVCVLQRHAHTHPFNGPLSGTTGVSRYQKGKTNLDFTEARDSEWQWHQLGHTQVCTSLQTDNHASIPLLSFFTGRMPFLSPSQQRQSTERSTVCCK